MKTDETFFPPLCSEVKKKEKKDNIIKKRNRERKRKRGNGVRKERNDKRKGIMRDEQKSPLRRPNE